MHGLMFCNAVFESQSIIKSVQRSNEGVAAPRNVSVVVHSPHECDGRDDCEENDGISEYPQGYFSPQRECLPLLCSPVNRSRSIVRKNFVLRQMQSV